MLRKKTILLKPFVSQALAEEWSPSYLRHTARDAKQSDLDSKACEMMKQSGMRQLMAIMARLMKGVVYEKVHVWRAETTVDKQQKIEQAFASQMQSKGLKMLQKIFIRMMKVWPIHGEPENIDQHFLRCLILTAP